MRFAALIPLMLLLVPIAEIAMFIVVGREIGVLWTLALLIGAGLAGAALLRFEGLRLLTAARADIAAGRMPAATIVHGAFLALAGLFLLLPGFLSDIVAFLLLLPPVRALLVRLVARNMTVVTRAGATTASWSSAGAGAGGRTGGPAVIDLEAVEVDRDGDRTGSPWRASDDPPRLGGP